MSKSKWNMLLSASSLLLGGMFYVLFRPNAYISLLFRESAFVVTMRLCLAPLSNNYVRFYLMDFLWGFSLNCALNALAQLKRNGILFCGAVAFSCGCVWEMLQYSGIISGTGDWIDVFAYLSASFCGTILNLKEKKI